MEINRHNYEMYILDYFEGKLSEEMSMAVMEFLKNNPDIENDTKELLDTVLISETVNFEDKDSLKKNPHYDIPGISKLEQLSIAYLEKDISEVENKQLIEILHKSDEKTRIHGLIQRTRIDPDLSIIYPNKIKLKHLSKTFKIRTYWSVLAIAASIALIVGLTLFLYQQKVSQLGSPISYKFQDIKTRSINTEKNSNQIKSVDKIQIQIKKQVEDSVFVAEKEIIDQIKSINLTELDIVFDKLSYTESDVIRNDLSNNSDDNEYVSLQVYLKDRFKEKVLKQNKHEKITFISIVNAIGRFTDKVLNKKLEVEKTQTEDGNLLYAIKTDSFDLYTKTKSHDKNKEKDR